MHRCLFLTLLIVVATSAEAQSPDAQRRRDEIARVQELVTDPDPLQRLANFEEIAAEGDAIKLQAAVRVAMTGNDQALRGLAFRAFLGGVKRFAADLSFEPALQQQLDRARQPESNRSQVRDVRDLAFFTEATAMRADFRITDFNIATGRGKARVGWFQRGAQDFDVQVIGERLLATVGVDGGRLTNCSIELRPTSNLRIEGHMVCQGAKLGRIAFTASMY